MIGIDKMSKNTIKNENTESTVEIRVLLSDIWRGIIKFGWIAVALAVLLGGVQFYRTRIRYVPVYTVSATFTVHTENAVLQGDNGVSAYSFYYDRDTADQLATVFPRVVGNKIVQNQVCSDLDVPVMPATVTATCVQGTNMVTLTAMGEDPQLTYDTLLSVIDNYSSVADYIIGRTKLVMINDPVVPQNPSNTSDWISSVSTAALIGLLLGLGWIMVYAILRKTIRTKDDIRNILNQHCIGMVPQVVFKKYRREIDKSIILTNPLIGNDFLESLRLLRGSVTGLLKNGEKSVMITSTAPDEGKTVVALNLAAILARDGKKVLVIDADMRNSGIQQILESETFTKNKKKSNEYFKVETVKNLEFDLLTFKDNVEGVQKIRRSPEIKSSLFSLRDDYDIILVDTPPCGIISDATVIARDVDAVIYVIRQDAVMQATIRTGINSLLESEANFIGCILNGAAGGIGGYGSYYKYGGYYRYYRYGYSSRYGYYSKKGRKSGKRNHSEKNADYKIKK